MNKVEYIDYHSRNSRSPSWSPVLNRRRLSNPEIIMRKHALSEERSRSNSNSDSSDSIPCLIAKKTAVPELPKLSRYQNFVQCNRTVGSESDLSRNQTRRCRESPVSMQMRKSALLRRFWSNKLEHNLSLDGKCTKSNPQLNRLSPKRMPAPPKLSSLNNSRRDLGQNEINDINDNPFDQKHHEHFTNSINERRQTRTFYQQQRKALFESHKSSLESQQEKNSSFEGSQEDFPHFTDHSSWIDSRSLCSTLTSDYPKSKSNYNSDLSKTVSRQTSELSSSSVHEKIAENQSSSNIISSTPNIADLVGRNFQHEAMQSVEFFDSKKPLYPQGFDLVDSQQSSCSSEATSLKNTPSPLCQLNVVTTGSVYRGKQESSDLLVPRLSAMPRTSSMEVMISSGELTGCDSDSVSLVDSLEDRNSPKRNAQSPIPSPNRECSPRRYGKNLSKELLVKSITSQLTAHNAYANPPIEDVTTKYDHKLARGELKVPSPPNKSNESPERKSSAYYIKIQNEKIESTDEVLKISEHIPKKVTEKIHKRQEVIQRKKESRKRTESTRIDRDPNGNVCSSDIQLPKSNFVNTEIRNLRKEFKNKKEDIIKSLDSFKIDSQGNIKFLPRDKKRRTKLDHSKTQPKGRNKSEALVKSLIENEMIVAQKPNNSNNLGKVKNSPTLPRRVYQKTEYNTHGRKIEILEIVECIDNADKTSKKCDTQKSKIPVPKVTTLKSHFYDKTIDTKFIYNNLVENQDVPLSQKPMNIAKAISNEVEINPQVDRLVASILIGNLQSSATSTSTEPQPQPQLTFHQSPKRRSQITHQLASQFLKPFYFEAIPEERSTSLESSADEISKTNTPRNNVSTSNETVQYEKSNANTEMSMKDKIIEGLLSKSGSEIDRNCNPVVLIIKNDLPAQNLFADNAVKSSIKLNKQDNINEKSTVSTQTDAENDGSNENNENNEKKEIERTLSTNKFTEISTQTEITKDVDVDSQTINDIECEKYEHIKKDAETERDFSMAKQNLHTEDIAEKNDALEKSIAIQTDSPKKLNTKFIEVDQLKVKSVGIATETEKNTVVSADAGTQACMSNEPLVNQELVLSNNSPVIYEKNDNSNDTDSFSDDNKNFYANMNEETLEKVISYTSKNNNAAQPKVYETHARFLMKKSTYKPTKNDNNCNSLQNPTIEHTFNLKEIISRFEASEENSQKFLKSDNYNKNGDEKRMIGLVGDFAKNTGEQINETMSTSENIVRFSNASYHQGNLHVMEFRNTATSPFCNDNNNAISNSLMNHPENVTADIVAVRSKAIACRNKNEPMGKAAEYCTNHACQMTKTKSKKVHDDKDKANYKGRKALQTPPDETEGDKGWESFYQLRSAQSPSNDNGEGYSIDIHQRKNRGKSQHTTDLSIRTHQQRKKATNNIDNGKQSSKKSLYEDTLNFNFIQSHKDKQKDEHIKVKVQESSNRGRSHQRTLALDAKTNDWALSTETKRNSHQCRQKARNRTISQVTMLRKYSDSSNSCSSGNSSEAADELTEDCNNYNHQVNLALSNFHRKKTTAARRQSSLHVEKLPTWSVTVSGQDNNPSTTDLKMHVKLPSNVRKDSNLFERKCLECERLRNIPSSLVTPECCCCRGRSRARHSRTTTSPTPPDTRRTSNDSKSSEMLTESSRMLPSVFKNYKPKSNAKNNAGNITARLRDRNVPNLLHCQISRQQRHVQPIRSKRGRWFYIDEIKPINVHDHSLAILGSMITPRHKPRVLTMSERDLMRSRNITPMSFIH